MPAKHSAQDARFLAQERIVDALLRALALQQPELMGVLRGILLDTEMTHTGKPSADESVHQQIRNRIRLASDFAEAHGTPQTGLVRPTGSPTRQ